MSEPTNYGTRYWCVQVMEHVAKDGRFFVHADDVRTTSDGALEFLRQPQNGKEVNRINFIIAAGQWISVYAASLLDGRPVSAEHWSMPHSASALAEADTRAPVRRRKR
jgi:hypothetical protein